MSECLRFVPMLSARRGELAPRDDADLHTHLLGCGACQARLADGAGLEGLVGEALLAEAARIDFAPFVDEVMARVEPRGWRGALRWIRRHKAVTALVSLAPTMVALGLIVYFRSEEVRGQAEDVVVISEGRTPTVLTTQDGPVVLLGDPSEPEGS